MYNVFAVTGGRSETPGSLILTFLPVSIENSLILVLLSQIFYCGLLNIY